MANGAKKRRRHPACVHGCNGDYQLHRKRLARTTRRDGRGQFVVRPGVLRVLTRIIADLDELAGFPPIADKDDITASSLS
jgi:hypothetical protein